MMNIIITSEALLRIATDLNEQGVGWCATVESEDGTFVDIMTPATAETLEN